MQTTEFVRDKWSDIFSYYQLPPITGNKHFKGECPLCGGKGKFRIDNKDNSGSWICRCGSGNGWSLLIGATGKDFQTLAKEIDQHFGNDFKAESKPKPVNNKLITAVNRFREIQPINDSQGEQYLNGRGIIRMPTGGIKFSPSEYCSEIEKRLPCLFAIASNEFGEPVQRHLTYLEGDRKAPVSKQKVMLSLSDYQGSISVKLFEVAETLGISEGIETALSAAQYYKVNTWSVLNTSIMKRFKAPSGVRKLVIFADNDKNGAGLAAAFECANKNILSNNDVTGVLIRWTDSGDFNDYLTNPQNVYEWRLGQ